MTLQRRLRIGAIVAFLIAAAGFPELGRVGLVPLGLALWVGSEV